MLDLPIAETSEEEDAEFVNLGSGNYVGVGGPFSFICIEVGVGVCEYVLVERGMLLGSMDLFVVGEEVGKEWRWMCAGYLGK